MTETILTYPQAAALVTRHTADLPQPAREFVELSDALERCLASPVLADRHQPPFDRSTRDGFAVRSADLRTRWQLNVTAQLPAGQPATGLSIHPGEAIEIMTGAPLPEGADAVLMVEHIASRNAEELRTITLDPARSLDPGDNVVPAGAEARTGDILLPAGTRMSPMHIGAAASCGITQLEVFVRPRVAILATGDELVELDQPVKPHQIRNSNSYSLAAQITRTGGIPIRLPISPDTREGLLHNLTQAVEADLILLSGGVSMGQYDLVEEVLDALHAEFLFTGVQIQPGRPAIFGHLPRASQPKYFFGLPGNPVSTMVTFSLFAAPMIRALAGHSDTGPLFAKATLAEPVRHKPGLTRFLPASLKTSWKYSTVTPVSWQGSGDLAATARANCFLVIPPDQADLASGAEVSVLLAYA